jgi:hypothetical protein
VGADETQRLLDEMEVTAAATISYPTPVLCNIALNACMGKTSARNAGNKVDYILLLRMHDLQ